IRPASYFEILPRSDQRLLAHAHWATLSGLGIAQGFRTAFAAISVFPGEVIMRPNGTAPIEVTDGSGGTLTVQDPSVVSIRTASGTFSQPRAPIEKDFERFDVVSMGKLGMTTITASAPMSLASVFVAVRRVSTPMLGGRIESAPAGAKGFDTL